MIINLSFKVSEPKTFERLDIGDKFLPHSELEMSDRGLACNAVWVKITESEGVEVDSSCGDIKEFNSEDAVYLLYYRISSLPKIEKKEV